LPIPPNVGQHRPGVSPEASRDGSPEVTAFMKAHKQSTSIDRAQIALALTALGVVFGDIGTSCLYGLREAAKAASPDGAPTSEAILGVNSLIIWSLLLIISIKYAILIMRADNHGEGGILALLALVIPRRGKPTRQRTALIVLGLVGAALLYGDGAITPAISVLSAIEGLEVDAPGLKTMVVPATVVILLALFLVQRKGAGFVGNVFGPIMLLWFLAIGLLGVRGIAMAPSVLAAFSPHHAILYLLHAGPYAFPVMGAAFLAVTGGEALYADMGHFGRLPIRLAWFLVALPSLVLNYLGQGGLLLHDPAGIANPFYLLAPAWCHYPLIALAAVATVIASQAIISGAYSLTQQAIQLGFLPRMHIVHTASHARGQIYIPLVNWSLAAATLGAVVAFGSSDALAGAYGIAVSLLMAITTFLATLIALRWRINAWIVLPVNLAFFCVDLVFVGANSLKLFEGGWFPLLLAFVIAFVMMTWRRGQEIARAARAELRDTMESFLVALKTDPPFRIKGTGIFLSSARGGVPLLLTHHLRHNQVLQENTLIVCAVTDERPRVAEEERVSVISLSEGVRRLIINFGFMETPDVPRAIRTALGVRDLTEAEREKITYYLGRETIIVTGRDSKMAAWRESLFAFMNRNAERSAAYFAVPSSLVIEIGIELEI
jgi:KUP system potassium uptake protein